MTTFDTQPRVFAFCDISGSTALADELGDTAFAELIATHNAVVRTALGGRGSEVHFLGDGFMAVFEDARAALAWAVEVVETTWTALGLRVRVGAHAGSAVRAEGSWLGRDVIVARRLCERARPGEILVSDRLRAVAGVGARFGEAREVGVRGTRAESACTLAAA